MGGRAAHPARRARVGMSDNLGTILGTTDRDYGTPAASGSGRARREAPDFPGNPSGLVEQTVGSEPVSDNPRRVIPWSTGKYREFLPGRKPLAARVRP